MRKKGSVNYQYKIRQVAQNQQGTLIHAITIPNFIAEKFKNTKFILKLENNCMIFSSGCDIKVMSKDDSFFDKYTKEKEIVQ